MSQSTIPDSTTAVGPRTQPPPPRLDYGHAPPSAVGDTVFSVLCHGAASIVILMLVSLIVVLVYAAWPSVTRFGSQFLTRSTWVPNEVPARDANDHLIRDSDGELVMAPPRFGALPVIYGTGVSSGLALVFAVPLSLGAALFLVRIAPTLKSSSVKAGIFGILLCLVLPRWLGSLAPPSVAGAWMQLLGFVMAVALMAVLVRVAARQVPRTVKGRLPFEIPLHVLYLPLMATVLHGFGTSWLAAWISAGIFSALVVWIAPAVGAVSSFLIEFLAAIPSIAYGLWGIFVLQPILASHIEPGMRSFVDQLPKNPVSWLPHLSALFYDSHGTKLSLAGRDLFCASLILAIMILPIITAVGRDVLRAVPRTQIEGSLALGATWWQSCKGMLRYSRSGLFGAIMLGLARAAGETMAVAMVIGNTAKISVSPFQSAQTMASLLANEFAEANDDLHRSALIEVALLLLVMSLLFNVIARYLVVGGGSRSAASA